MTEIMTTSTKYWGGVSCLWSYKMKLTFTGNVSTTNLDDFPVLVHLTNLNFNFNHAQNNGEDIRFMDSDTCPTDGTPLKHEIDCWSKVGQEAYIWVKVPRIDANSVVDFIYMYFGNPAAPDGQDPTNVWDANFKGVFHMTDGANNQLIADSTINANTLTKIAAGAPAEATAHFCESQDFDGVDDRAVKTNVSIPTYATVECWVNFDNLNNAHRPSGLPNTKYGTLAQNCVHNGIGFYYTASGKDWIIGNSLFNGVSHSTGEWQIATGVWYHLVVLLGEDNVLRLYVNGTQRGSKVASAMGDGDRLCVGAYPYGDVTCYEHSAHHMDGKLDEVRFSNIGRSADWVMGQYLSQTDALITYSAEE